VGGAPSYIKYGKPDVVVVVVVVVFETALTGSGSQHRRGRPTWQ
jgi:hypothetical protein